MVVRKSIALLAVTILLCSAAMAAKSGGMEYLTPTAFDRTAEVLVSGKLRTYYLLEAGTKVEVQVQGPSQLLILSRGVSAQPSDPLKYEFLALRKKSRKAISITQTSRTTDKVVFSGDMEGNIGYSRKKYLDVPKGDHTYTFYLPKNSTDRILIRIAAVTNAFTSGTPVVAMTPTEFTTQVDVVAREETATYYRIGTGYTVALDLIGPATLKVLSRIEFDANMNGKQKWRVRVTEDGKVKGTYSLAARKSTVTAYREPSSMVASRAETFFVEIPEGSHRYEFVLPENHRTVLMKFLLPKSQLERE
ncbi:MAG: hypothetical protein ACOZB3_04940 [Calditrichota bacterium]